MIELYLTIRDAIGEGTFVNYQGERTLIKDLPAGQYNLRKGDELIALRQSPNNLPSRLLEIADRNELPVHGLVGHLSQLSFTVEEAA